MTPHLREPTSGFDWDAVEDPVGIVLEELGPGFTRAQAETVWGWHLRRGRADQAGEITLTDRILLWIGGADDQRGDLRAIRRPDRTAENESAAVVESPLERRVGLRAAVAIKELHAYSRLGRLSYKAIAAVFNCSHGEVWRLTQNFRAAVPQHNPSEPPTIK